MFGFLKVEVTKSKTNMKSCVNNSVKIIIMCVLLYTITPLYAADLIIDVNVASFIRTIPETLYGTSMTAWWDFEAGTKPAYNNLMLATGQKYVRWPGGSWGDCHLWSDMEGPGGAYTWKVNYNEELYMLGILGATMQPIVNFPGYWYEMLYGHEDAVDAAVAWVIDQSSRAHPAQYWEIGNETFGPWEAGWFEGMCGAYYGENFADFYIAMKAVNPDIKIGAVAQPYDVPDWWNPGLWTRDMLNAAYAEGVVPDFLIIHSYPGSGTLGDYNPIILSDDVDEIEYFTYSMNYIISDTIGPEYVGQIEYCMTEWNAGGVEYDSHHPNEPYYERWRLYSGALFLSQYLMEMSKYGWTGSNSFDKFFYQSWMPWGYPAFYPFPDWYVYPFFINRFGRDMVDASSSNPIVRAYAAIDDSNDLTIFIVNNSPDANLTAQIDISGLSAGTNGKRWVIEPAGPMQAGGTTIQDKEDVKINGIFHPNPLTLGSLAQQIFASGNTFEIMLPKSCMIFLKVPNAFGEPYGDFTDDGIVNFYDLSEFCEIWWLEDDCNKTVGLDLNDDCIINFYEFSFFAQNWLEGI
jgi:hypothetical protein